MQNTEAAALSLKDLLGTIELEPILGRCEVENGKLIETRSYYLAHTNIDTLALLGWGQGYELVRTTDPGGTNSYHGREFDTHSMNVN
jgi:hypothetical protein